MDLRQFILNTILGKIGNEPDYKIREYALNWLEKSVLTEDDIHVIDNALPTYALTLDQTKDNKQEENKKALAKWLEEHPLTWTDGNVYGVTQEDQEEMALNLQQYQLQKAAGIEATLEWHTQKKRCHEFTEEQYGALLLQVINYVYPYRRKQEAIKEKIYMAQSIEELNAVVIDYSVLE